MGPILGALAAAAPIIGGVADFITGRKDREEDIKLQREFAQNGISWKVEDAKRAGIHPLYALGANTTAYQAAVGGSSGSFSQMGQDFSSAIDRTRTAEGKVSALQTTMDALGVRRAQLENDLLASQIAKLNAPAQPPMAGSDYLVPGQTSSGLAFPPGGDWKNTIGSQPGNARAGVSMGGNPWEFDARLADAQTMEDRYGDVVEGGFGIWNLFADFFHNAPYSPFTKKGQEAWANYQAQVRGMRNNLPPGAVIMRRPFDRYQSTPGYWR